MNKTKLSYIKKLIEWKSSQKMALLGEECVRDLIAMDSSRANELPAASAQVAKRIAYIADGLKYGSACRKIWRSTREHTPNPPPPWLPSARLRRA